MATRAHDPLFSLPAEADPADHGPLEPVELLHVREHEFAGKKVKGARCEYCSRAASNIAHHGYPPSLNVGGSGWNPFVFQGVKGAWQTVLTDLMVRSGLPRPLGSVLAQGVITFPTRGPRDQGNFKFVLEKALGDALQEGGWLESDTFFPIVRYEFGELTARYEKGVAQTRLMLFPAWPGEERDAAAESADSGVLFGG